MINPILQMSKLRQLCLPRGRVANLGSSTGASGILPEAPEGLCLSASAFLPPGAPPHTPAQRQLLACLHRPFPCRTGSKQRMNWRMWERPWLRVLPSPISNALSDTNPSGHTRVHTHTPLPPVHPHSPSRAWVGKAGHTAQEGPGVWVGRRRDGSGQSSLAASAHSQSPGLDNLYTAGWRERGRGLPRRAPCLPPQHSRGLSDSQLCA